MKNGVEGRRFSSRFRGGRAFLLAAMQVLAIMILSADIATVSALTRDPTKPLSLLSLQGTLSTSVVATVVFSFADPTCCFTAHPVHPVQDEAHVPEFNLANGNVRLEDPLVFPHLQTLNKPTLLGSGGGGAVFSFDGSTTVVKVSWQGSADSVERECDVLKTLEKNKVQGVERCLGQVRYPDDSRRVMIALERLVKDAVANPIDLDESLQPHAIECILRTLIQMLVAKVVTVDIQPLISTQTGDVLFIDFTEAIELKQPLSFLDVTLVSSFCAEMAALIPDSLLPVASKALLNELKALEKQGVKMPNEIYTILAEQPFASDEVIGFIDPIVKQNKN